MQKTVDQIDARIKTPKSKSKMNKYLTFYQRFDRKHNYLFWLVKNYLNQY